MPDSINFSQESKGSIPSRLHHNAYVVSDQEATRHFYEDLIGMPLTQFWIERVEYMGETLEYSHSFFGLSDGSALAFFHFADPDHYARFKIDQRSLFVHIALNTDRPTNEAICKRLRDAGYTVTEIDHGYTQSVYVNDPDGLLVEFCVDPDDVEAIGEMQRRTAHESLRRWMSGDRTPNNDIRH